MKVRKFKLAKKTNVVNSNEGPFTQLTLSPAEVKTMRFCLSTACQAVSQSGSPAADEIRQLAIDFRPALEEVLLK